MDEECYDEPDMRRFLSVLCTAGIVLGTWSPIPASALPCSGADHFEVVRVVSDASPVSGAQVTFYTNSIMTLVADNLQTSGTQDAVVTTGSDGSATLSLAAGQYFVRILANQYYAYTSSIIMPSEGVCGSDSFSLTKAGQADLSLDLTTVTLSPTTIANDGIQTATLTIQARNNVGSVMPNQVVDLQTNLSGMFITHNATSTDAIGKATFTMRATLTGTAQLIPYVNGQIVKPVMLTVVNSLGGNATSTALSASRSSIVASPSIVASDGVSASHITITIRDANGIALPGIVVSPRSTLDGNMFTPTSGVTNSTGVATFDATATSSGLAIITAVAGSIGLSDRPTVQFGVASGTGTGTDGTSTGSGPASAAIIALRGHLVKLHDDGDPRTQQDTTVYYVGSDDQRHAFPDEKTYFTWYTSYGNVSIVSADVLATIQLGMNVTAKPGVRLIKFPSDPKVYAVSYPNVLRWLSTSDVAVQLFGSAWSKNVNDLSEAFAPNYSFGTQISASPDYNTTQEISRAGSIDGVLVR